MIRKTLSLLLLAALGCAAPAPVRLSPEKLRQVDAVVEDMVAKNKIAGAVVLIAKDGAPVFTGTYGKMDLEAGTPMRPDAIFRIYSMTKGIVSAAALTLVEEGKLKLDAPLSDLIPEFKDLQVAAPEGMRAPSRAPTVKDLFLHTAGFLYGNDARPAGKSYAEKKPLEAPSL